MSKKNKRYVVYKTVEIVYNFHSITTNYITSTNGIIWSRFTMDRKDLIVYAAKLLDYNNSPFFQYLIDDIDDPNIEVYKYIKPQIYRDIRDYKKITLTWHCIKVIHNNEEIPINYTALFKEVIKRRDQLNRPKHHNWYTHRKYHSCWKDQYKCKHQYEIHINNHKDTYIYDKYTIDNEIEDSYESC